MTCILASSSWNETEINRSPLRVCTSNMQPLDLPVPLNEELPIPAGMCIGCRLSAIGASNEFISLVLLPVLQYSREKNSLLIVSQYNITCRLNTTIE